MADDNLGIALTLTALVLAAFAWMVFNAHAHKRRSEHRARELHTRVTGLEHRAAQLEKGVGELRAHAERKAEQAYVEKRINGLIALVKGKGD
jgi:hypothetical protein